MAVQHMDVFRVFVICVLLDLVRCEMTVEQATKCTLRNFCTSFYGQEGPVAQDDADAIYDLLGCSRGRISSSSSFASIYVVACNCALENQTECRVTDINFSGRRLEGQIPENIGGLAYLKTLYLSGNKFKGSIPDSFHNLTKLVNLNLCDNSLEGPIPPFFLKMQSLETLYLCRNFFNETIPPGFGSLSSLKYLHLGYNLLSGEIPDVLGNIVTLNGLYLMDNQLTNVLPHQLGNLINLQELWLENNQFIGVLPLSFKSLKKLRYFNVRGNNFSETIPDFIELWEDLRIMNLMGNKFSARLPGQISKLKNLNELYISDLGPETSPFPDLSGMKFLRVLTLRNCSVVGRVPDWIWNLSSLQYLDLSFNNLSGAIPSAVNTSLKWIFLRGNELSETIPAWMNNNSRYVDVSNNLFRNVIIDPARKVNPNMNLFPCCSNKTYEVGKSDEVDFPCNEPQLNDHLFINCGGESISVNGRDYEPDVHPRGESTFFRNGSSNWGYSSMGIFLWADRNKYTINDTCQIHVGDAKLYSTARVSPISLKYYGCLKNGVYNVKLHFAEISSRSNKVSHSKAGRAFDVDIQDKPVLTDFSIEKEAGGVNKAIIKENTITVSNGRLKIHLYWSGKGSVLYPSPYYGPLISAITVTPDRSGLSNGVLAGISGIALLLLILFIGFVWRFEDKLRQEEQEHVELYPGGLYNYKKIKAATKNFGTENRLGEGGFGTVYKGTLSNGTAIAVKKLSETKEGIFEFLEKSRTIAGMKHPNLVTLMGYCAGKNQLLLIYEYIGNNTLEDALFGSDQLRARLDWPTRYKICLGLAEGLSFLHEGSKQEIIHGNIKPENILLDNDLNPKIYDFDFARLYDKQKSEETASYTEPEVGNRPLAASGDVYSFGVVTLILFTGKKIKIPRAGGETDYLVDEAQKKHRMGTLMELVDQNLTYIWEEAELILKLAMQCVDTRPFRPSMSTVVKILKNECSIETILVNASKPEGDFSM